MNVLELKNRFIVINKQEPIDDSELLNFAKVCYVRGEIKIKEYKNLVKVLEKDYLPEGTEDKML